MNALIGFGLVVAVIWLVYILRAEGDESIGFGGRFECDDNDDNNFVNIPKVESLGVPDETTGVVESKPLDLAGAVVRKIATIHNGGNFQVKIQLTAAVRARLETIRTNRKARKFRIKIPIDTGTLQITVPGIVTSNKIDDLEAEKINTFTCMIEVSGQRSTADTILPPA